MITEGVRYILEDDTSKALPDLIADFISSSSRQRLTHASINELWQKKVPYFEDLTRLKKGAIRSCLHNNFAKHPSSTNRFPVWMIDSVKPTAPAADVDSSSENSSQYRRRSGRGKRKWKRIERHPLAAAVDNKPSGYDGA